VPKKAVDKNSLESVRAAIEKDFGAGSMFMLGDNPRMDVERIPSGIFALDLAMGGGFATNSIVELYGPPGSGKSSLAMRLTAALQEKGRVCTFIDAEHGMNKELAVKCGVDVDNLLFNQPAFGEQALEIADRLIRSPEVGCVVVDSVAALIPRAELEGEIGDSHVGLQGRMMSQALRKITSTLNTTDSPAMLVFINQIREKIGGMSFAGPSTTTSGGRALPFYASIRCEVIRIGQVKHGDTVIGHDVKVKVLKNRFAPAFQEAFFTIFYDERGMSDSSGVIKLADKMGLLVKSGSWYADPDTGEKLGNGFLNTVDYLDENPETLDALKEEIVSNK
jgi:recombination protein RecA